VSESVNWRKHELECIRLAADCMQLVAMLTALLCSRISFGWRGCGPTARFGDRARIRIRIEPTDVAQTASGFSSTPVPAYC